MNTSIVIPNYNRYDLVHQTLYDIYQHCMPVEEVIVVNDGCDQRESFTGLEWWKTTNMLPVRALNLEENVGFLKASNAGMRDAKGDVIILLSNDVRIRGDIVSRIEHILRHGTALVGGRYLDWDTGWNAFDGVVFPYIEGWLLASTRTLWEQVGYFDERFVPCDYEDIDLSTKFLSLGHSLVSLPEDITHHMGAQSIGYNEKREKQTKINRKKFEEKWVK